MPLAKVGHHYGKMNLASAVLNSMNPENSWFFLNGDLLGTIYIYTHG
jgi:hypothetical protein